MATRSTQLTYSQIKSVCGTICMRRSCNQGSKSVDEGEIKDPKSSIENFVDHKAEEGEIRDPEPSFKYQGLWIMEEEGEFKDPEPSIKAGGSSRRVK